MNLKTLRKDYKNLTMLERLSLADNAEARTDESEIKAVIAASPHETYTQTDFYNLKREITDFRLMNLIVRLGYIMQFDFLFDNDFSDAAQQTSETKLVAYLYVRATDSWKILSDELGFRDDFDELMGVHLFAVLLLNLKDEMLREIAFTEPEAANLSKKQRI